MPIFEMLPRIKSFDFKSDVLLVDLDAAPLNEVVSVCDRFRGFVRQSIVVGDAFSDRVLLKILDSADCFVQTPFNYGEFLGRFSNLSKRILEEDLKRISEASFGWDRLPFIGPMKSPLPQDQYSLLLRLTEASGEVVQEDDLYADIFQKPIDGSTRLRKLIFRLRKKLNASGSRLRIASKHGHGYYLERLD